MKITMICDVLGEANNGTTLAALNLIAHLRGKGHQLTVVSPDAYRTEAGFVAVPELNLGFLLNKVLQKNVYIWQNRISAFWRRQSAVRMLCICSRPFPLPLPA